CRQSCRRAWRPLLMAIDTCSTVFFQLITIKHGMASYWYWSICQGCPIVEETLSRCVRMRRDFIIIGGGVVGLAVAYGLARRGRSVCVLDEHDGSLRASRGNAGLIWVQGKGADMPRYAQLSLATSRAWPAFARELTERT